MQLPQGMQRQKQQYKIQHNVWDRLTKEKSVFVFAMSFDLWIPISLNGYALYNARDRKRHEPGNDKTTDNPYGNSQSTRDCKDATIKAEHRQLGEYDDGIIPNFIEIEDVEEECWVPSMSTKPMIRSWKNW